MDGAKISNSYVHATNDKSAIPIYNNFNYVKSNRTKRGSGINNRTNNNNNTNNTNNTNHDLHNTLEFDPNKFITNIIESTKDNICNTTRKSIMNLTIDNIRQLLIFTAKELHISEISYPYNEYLLYVIQDICLHKLVGSHNFKIKDKSNRFIILDYKNALMDKINLSKLIKGKAIQQLFPVNDKLYSRPDVSYSYSPTI